MGREAKRGDVSGALAQECVLQHVVGQRKGVLLRAVDDHPPAPVNLVHDRNRVGRCHVGSAELHNQDVVLATRREIDEHD